MTLYKKDYHNGSPDYVQEVDLSQGARLKLLHGDITEPRPSGGSFGGPDPRMTSPALSTFWRQMTAEDSHTFCVVNGGFFYMPEYPTRLAFPLKVDGRMVTEGWGIDTYVGEHLMLALWDDHADILPMTQESLYASDAPNILGGLSENANKRAKFAVGRTFVGLADRDEQPGYETVLILATRTATQSGAAQALRSLGAIKVMMLDGGGSTQLRCRSGDLLPSERPIPQAVAVVAATPAQVAAQLLDVTQWPVLHVGQGFPLRMQVRNTGVVSWTQSSTSLIINAFPHDIPYPLRMLDTVASGQQTVITHTLEAYQRPGVYPMEINWGIQHQGKFYSGKTIRTYAVVLPLNLVDRAGELQQDLADWDKNNPEEVQTRLETWMANIQATPLAIIPQGTPGAASLTDIIHMEDALWIPLLMLPIVLTLGLLITRRDKPNN